MGLKPQVSSSLAASPARGSLWGCRGLTHTDFTFSHLVHWVVGCGSSKNLRRFSSVTVSLWADCTTLAEPPPPGGRRAPATIKGAISPAMHVRWARSPGISTVYANRVMFGLREWINALFVQCLRHFSLWSRKIIEVKTRKVCVDPKTCLSNAKGQGPGEINPPNFS